MIQEHVHAGWGGPGARGRVRWQGGHEVGPTSRRSQSGTLGINLMFSTSRGFWEIMISVRTGNILCVFIMSMGVKRLTKLEVLASWKLFGYFHLSFQESLVVERDSFNATL